MNERTAKRLADAQAALAAQKELLKKQEAARVEATEAAKTAHVKIRSLAFSLVDQRLFGRGMTTTHAVQVFDAESGTLSQTLEEASRGRCRPLGYLDASGKLYTGGVDRRALVWNAAAPWRLERVIGGADRPEVLADRVLSVGLQPRRQTAGDWRGRCFAIGEVKIFNVKCGWATGARD